VAQATTPLVTKVRHHALHVLLIEGRRTWAIDPSSQAARAARVTPATRPRPYDMDDSLIKTDSGNRNKPKALATKTGRPASSAASSAAAGPAIKPLNTHTATSSTR
jgi:hypothetical protein